MTVNLTSDIHKFWSYSQRLRQIFEDTKKCFDDINASGNFDGSKLRTFLFQSLVISENHMQQLGVISIHT